MVSPLHSLITQRHPTLNPGLDFNKLTSGSNRKIWWLGECGHKWERRVFSQVKDDRCMVCIGSVILPGFNDIATLFPEYFAELHPIKNSGLDFYSIKPFSNIRVWWQCAQGHEWETKIVSRTGATRKSACPTCVNKRVAIGFNDILTTHPELAAEWHPTQNGELSPTSFSYGSRLTVWWKCFKGHEWEDAICDRSATHSKERSFRECPRCAGYYDKKEGAIPDSLAAEWHPTKNGTLLTSDVSKGSDKKVWWKDAHKHEWEASVSSRVGGKGCPFCGNRYVLSGFNDLLTKNPLLAAEWHSTKNSEVKVSEVSSQSNYKAWWKGACGHEWEATVGSRFAGNGCPYCANRSIIPGFNDLASSGKDYVAEWHPTKNGDLLPTQFSRSSGRKVWWLCKKNPSHEWEMMLSSRYSGQNCPQCAAHNFVSRAEHELFTYLTGLGLTVEQSNRKVLGKNREIDLWLPEQKVGIEFNGVYWHSEKFLGQKYHHDKYVAAKAAGVQLLQVWEDDWNSRRAVIESALAHKLGVGQRGRVFARKTSVVMLSTLEAQTFLNSYHIQGFASGSYYVGLVDSSNSVVAVLVLKKETGNTLNIIRYATSVQVVGGFTKLLSYAERMYQPARFITFADHTVSDGGLYEGNGFVTDKVLPPDYMYVVQGERKHKFGYRLKRFRNDPDLLWQEGLTERELAELNGLPRVWDAGKTRYVRVVG